MEIGSRVTPSERQGVGSSPARSLSNTLDQLRVSKGRGCVSKGRDWIALEGEIWR